MKKKIKIKKYYEYQIGDRIQLGAGEEQIHFELMQKSSQLRVSDEDFLDNEGGGDDIIEGEIEDFALDSESSGVNSKSNAIESTSDEEKENYDAMSFFADEQPRSNQRIDLSKRPELKKSNDSSLNLNTIKRNQFKAKNT